MSELLQSFWQSNIELSLLLVAVLIARFLIHKTTKIYNSYLLWLSIPVGLFLAKLVSSIELSKPPVVAVNYAVQNYIVQPSTTIQSWSVLGVFWAIVAGMLLLRLILQHLSLRKELASISVGINLKSASRYPIVGIDKDDFSPAVYGFISPKIYFPIQLQASLSNKQTQLIIRHEEHHITQQHLWLNLLWDISVCIFWFNPLMYISRQGFRHDQELFCDYLVLNQSNNQDDHQSYGHALLSTVTATHSVSLLCSWKNFNQLEERIMNLKKSTSLGAKVAITCLAAIIVASTSLYAVSAEHYDGKGSLSSSIDDNGNSEFIWKDGNKHFVEQNGERFAVRGESRDLMTLEENQEFTKILKNSKNSNKDSLRHSVNDEGEEIVWRTGNTSYIQKNGEKSVSQNGVVRPMTVQEAKSFEEKVELTQKENGQYQEALRKAKNKRINQKLAAKASPKSRQESFRHEEHDNGRTEINWTKDGKTMIITNGQHYVIDENGKREMTKDERERLEEKVKQSQREWGVDKAQARDHEREHQLEQRKHRRLERESERAHRAEERERRRSERERHRIEKEEHAMQQRMEKEQHAIELAHEAEERKHLELETQHQEFERQQEELLTQRDEYEVQWQEFAEQQEEFAVQMQEFEQQMHEYEIAPEVFQEQLQEFSMLESEYGEYFQDGQLSEATMREIEHSLEIAEKQFKADRVDLKKKLERARQGIKEARIQLHKRRASLHKSPMPSLAPVTPKSTNAPIPPKVPDAMQLRLNPIAPLSPSKVLPPRVAFTPDAAFTPRAALASKAKNKQTGVIQIPRDSSDSQNVEHKGSPTQYRAKDFDSFDISQPH